MHSVVEFHLGHPDSVCSVQNFKYIHVINLEWSLWRQTQKPNNSVKGQIPKPCTELTHTWVHLWRGYSPGTNSPDCICLVSWFKVSLQALAQGAQHPRTLHTADYCEGREQDIFAIMVCLACQNSFVWKLHNEGCQHRPRSRACHCAGRTSGG